MRAVVEFEDTNGIEGYQEGEVVVSGADLKPSTARLDTDALSSGKRETIKEPIGTDGTLFTLKAVSGLKVRSAC